MNLSEEVKKEKGMSKKKKKKKGKFQARDHSYPYGGARRLWFLPNNFLPITG
jgi:hypothetical protein